MVPGTTDGDHVRADVYFFSLFWGVMLKPYTPRHCWRRSCAFSFVRLFLNFGCCAQAKDYQALLTELMCGQSSPTPSAWRERHSERDKDSDRDRTATATETETETATETETETDRERERELYEKREELDDIM